jgi:hypothetical protein
MTGMAAPSTGGVRVRMIASTRPGGVHGAGAGLLLVLDMLAGGHHGAQGGSATGCT